LKSFVSYVIIEDSFSAAHRRKVCAIAVRLLALDQAVVRQIGLSVLWTKVQGELIKVQ
jgi:hypothetical protein